jgi:hypothetical protein
VIQELVYMACRLICSGRRYKVRFGRRCPGFRAFEEVYNMPANLGDEKAVCPERRESTLLFQTGTVPKELAQGFLPPWYVGWFLKGKA